MLLAAPYIALAACGDHAGTAIPLPVQVDSVRVTPPSVTLRVGETVRLVGIVFGDSASVRRGVQWSSIDTTRAVVDRTGLVTARSGGIVVVEATSVSNVSVRSAATVSVVPRTGSVVGVALPWTSLQLVAGQTIRLPAVVSVTDSSVSNGVTFRTSNASVARVDATTGDVTAVAPGSATVTAIALADTTKRASTSVTVSPYDLTVRQIVVQPSNAMLVVGATQQFVAIVPTDTSLTHGQRAVRWASSDSSRLTIDSTGLATARAAGVVTVSATSVSNPSLVGMATAAIPAPFSQVQSVTLAPASATLRIGGTVQLAATVVADTGITRAVTYASSDAAIASVTATGLVTARASGTAIVTATSVADTTKRATSTITVSP